MVDYSKLCTILVNSCDSYEEAWKPFFVLFKKYWPNCPFSIVLATQSKTYDSDEIVTIHTGEGAWSTRINRALKKIKTKYVLLFLEDYFLLAPVKERELLNCFDKVIKDDDFGAIFFNKIAGFNVESSIFEGYYDMNKSDIIEYHLNCQISIWDRNVFEEATRIPMSPWDFEMTGYGVVSESVRKRGFYCSQFTVHTRIQENDIFSYLVHPKNGIGISKSRWLWNNKKLFKEHGIQCRCETLPVMSSWEYYWPIYRHKLLFPLYNIYTWIRKWAH